MLSKEYNIHYKACVEPLIYLFLQDWIYVLQYTSWNFSSNTGKVNFEGLVHLLRYMSEKKLGLKYYTKIEDVPIYDLLRQSIIKTENQLVVLYDSICQD